MKTRSGFRSVTSSATASGVLPVITATGTDRPRPDLAEQVGAGGAGERQVEDDQVERPGQEGDGPVNVGRLNRLPTPAGEDPFHQ